MACFQPNLYSQPAVGQSVGEAPRGPAWRVPLGPGAQHVILGTPGGVGDIPVPKSLCLNFGSHDVTKLVFPSGSLAPPSTEHKRRASRPLLNNYSQEAGAPCPTVGFTAKCSLCPHPTPTPLLPSPGRHQTLTGRIRLGQCSQLSPLRAQENLVCSDLFS